MFLRRILGVLSRGPTADADAVEIAGLVLGLAGENLRWGIVREDHDLVAGEFLRGPTPCLPATVSVGGGMQVVNVEPADFGTKLQESSPGGHPPRRRGPSRCAMDPPAMPSPPYTVCMNKPNGYEIVRTKMNLG